MTELTEASLEAMLHEIWSMTDSRGKKIAVEPTKVYVHPYPDETVEEYVERLNTIKALMTKENCE